MNIHQSIDRILESEELVLGITFYEVFLRQYPEVQRFFSGINMQRQAALLTMAMLVVEQNYGSRYPATARYLLELGAKHRESGIPVETYPRFRAALLDALRGFHGDDWDDLLATEWENAIDQAVEQMLRAYPDEQA